MERINEDSLSRRAALHQLFLGATVLLSGTTLTQARSAPLAPQETKPLGIALVGLGNYSTNQLAPALQHTKLCRLAGIVTGTPEKAKQWQEKYHIPDKNIYNYQTFDRIADNPDIDIVYVVLPNSMHAEYTIRAAKAGKHVICEKPMALTVKEAETMIAACKLAKHQLSIGYRLYFEPHHLEARRMGTEKIFGKVKLIEASLGFSMANPQSWRLNKKMGGGGAIMDLGLYAVQGARRVTGEEPISVTARGYVRDKTIFKDIFEAMTWQLEFPGGAIANSSTTYTSYVDRLYASAEQGWFTLNPAFNAVGTKGLSGKGPMEFTAPPYQQIAQMDDFARCVTNGEQSIASGEEGIKDLRVIEAIVRAAETGNKTRIA